MKTQTNPQEGVSLSRKIASLSVLAIACLATVADQPPPFDGCGDGDSDPGEECDLGGGNFFSLSDDCNTQCRFMRCGNGLIEQSQTGFVEACDDGNTLDGDGCDQLCQIEPFCGDGAVNPGEDCDDGNHISGDGCRADCLGVEQCGDGVADSAQGEVCDDGNTADGDACSANCSAISGSLFTSAPINGFDPSLADVAVFGEGAVGANRILFLVGSSDPGICSTIQSSTFIDPNGNTHSGLDAFLQNAISGFISETTVVLFVQRPDAATPFAAGNLKGDGQSLLIDSGFVIGDGNAALVDTTFGGDFNGSLHLQSLTPTDLAGQYDGLQRTEFVGGELLNVRLSGIFVGTHCQAITDGLQSAFGQ